MWLFLELEGGNLEAIQEASIHAGSRGLPDLATLEEVWNWLPGALERLYRTRCWDEVGSGRRRKEEKGARKERTIIHLETKRKEKCLAVF